jgi:hypothetical protein
MNTPTPIEEYAAAKRALDRAAADWSAAEEALHAASAALRAARLEHEAATRRVARAAVASLNFQHA